MMPPSWYLGFPYLVEACACPMVIHDEMDQQAATAKPGLLLQLCNRDIGSM
jgi:hypothetical protein